jgi:hypothetical protein
MRLVVTGALLGIAAIAASPAQQSKAAAAEAGREEPRNPDVIVRGYRERKKQGLIAASSLRNSAVQTRHRLARSSLFARCAARGRLAPPARLRAVVDAVVGSTSQVVAQNLLKRTHITCSADGGALLSVTTAEGADGTNALARAVAGGNGSLSFAGAAVGVDPFALGRSRYDRGALMIAALERFAPELTLTRRQTYDPAVQRRFDEREIPRNRLRQDADRLFFQVAVCMVRMEPELATRVALNQDRTLASDLQGALIDSARDCVGGARRVAVDPTDLRMYVADAVYRWAVAARGVDTLVVEQG